MFSNFLVKTSTKTKPFKAHIESEVVLDVKSQTNWLVFISFRAVEVAIVIT